MTGCCSECGRPFAEKVPLTRVQAEIVQYLRDYIEIRGFAPSYEEIAARFGYRSLATVHEHIGNLEDKGWVTREYNRSRTLELVA